MDEIFAFYSTVFGLQVLLVIAAFIFHCFLIWRFIRATSDIRTMRDEISELRYMHEVEFRARQRALAESTNQPEFQTQPPHHRD